MRILPTLFFFALALATSFAFYDVLDFFVTYLKSGWVFGSIYIRFLVICFFAIGLHLLLSTIRKGKKMKFILTFLIALLPGFGISFITPVYDIDYGYYGDDLELIEMDSLEVFTNGAYHFSGERTVITFFTTVCPHCMSVSQKLGTNLQAGQEVSVVSFFPGTKEDTEFFLEQNNGQAFEMYLIDDKTNFTGAGGHVFPSVFVIGPDGSTEQHYTGDVVNYTALDHIYDLKKQ